jgi:hypothetical protein
MDRLGAGLEVASLNFDIHRLGKELQHVKKELGEYNDTKMPEDDEGSAIWVATGQSLTERIAELKGALDENKARIRELEGDIQHDEADEVEAMPILELPPPALPLAVKRPRTLIHVEEDDTDDDEPEAKKARFEQELKDVRERDTELWVDHNQEEHDHEVWVGEQKDLIARRQEEHTAEMARREEAHAEWVREHKAKIARVQKQQLARGGRVVSQSAELQERAEVIEGELRRLK